jgi:chemotaxis family two-component system response regulator Rcp1
MLSRIRRIMVIDDNAGDVELLTLALKQTGHPFQVQVATDGEQAIELLKNQSGSAFERPELILLDLNLPKKNGHQVLAAIRADPTLSMIPVVILSSSSDEIDIRAAYDARANCYLQKPQTVEAVFKLVNALEAFWFQSAVLPQ